MNTRKLFLISAGVVVLVAAGLFGLKTAYESKVRNGIENFLANLPAPLEVKAGKIDVSFFSRSIVISDLTGNYTGDSEITFSAAKISASGINTDAAGKNAGTTDIARNLEIENIAYNSALLHVTAAHYAYRNISGDLMRIIDESIKSMPVIVEAYSDPAYHTSSQKQMKLLGDLAPFLEAMETLTVGGASLRDYSYTVPILTDQMGTVTIAEGEMGKYSLREMGNMLFKNITFTPEDSPAPLIQLESLGMDGATLPSFVELFKTMGTGITSSTALKATLQGQKFALRNLNIKNLAVHNPENPEQSIITLADSSFTYVAESSHDMSFDFNGLKIRTGVLAANADIPAETLALLPDPLSHSGIVQIRAAAGEEGSNSYDFECTKIALKEDVLGSFAMSFAIGDINVMALMMGMPGPAALKNFDLTVTDTGASDVFYTTLAASEEGHTAADLRGKAVSDLPAPETLPNDALRGLVGAIKTFLEQPGNTLRITLAPVSPLNLQELQATAVNDPEKLGLTASTSPAQ